MADPYQEAIRRIGSGGGTIASSRFTKTPMLFINGQNKEIGGEYLGGSHPIIGVDLGQNPTYQGFSNILHHEDIHALLNQAGKFRPQLDAPNLIDQLKNLFYLNSLRTAQQGFQRGKRAGDLMTELPAYMGAYKEGEVPGASQSNADDYVTVLKRALTPPVASNYQRIVDSVKASKR